MNRPTLLLFAAVAALLLSLPTSRANNKTTFGVAGLARYHQSHSMVEEWPFDKGDMSFGASLRVHDGMGYLEAGCEYAPDPTASKGLFDEVITPFARLAIKDQGLVVAIGVRDNYITYADDARDSEWADLLYELHLGLDFEFGPVSVGGGAYYSYDDWNDLKDFDVDDLEYGVHVGVVF